MSGITEEVETIMNITKILKTIKDIFRSSGIDKPTEETLAAGKRQPESLEFAFDWARERLGYFDRLRRARTAVGYWKMYRLPIRIVMFFASKNGRKQLKTLCDMMHKLESAVIITEVDYNKLEKSMENLVENTAQAHWCRYMFLTSYMELMNIAEEIMGLKDSWSKERSQKNQEDHKEVQ